MGEHIREENYLQDKIHIGVYEFVSSISKKKTGGEGGIINAVYT